MLNVGCGAYIEKTQQHFPSLMTTCHTPDSLLFGTFLKPIKHLKTENRFGDTHYTCDPNRFPCLVTKQLKFPLQGESGQCMRQQTNNTQVREHHVVAVHHQQQVLLRHVLRAQHVRVDVGEQHVVEVGALAVDLPRLLHTVSYVEQVFVPYKVELVLTIIL